MLQQVMRGLKSVAYSVISCLLAPKTACVSVRYSSNMSKLFVGVCQMTCGSNIEENMTTCEKLVKRAKERGAAMAFLPEGFDYISESRQSASQSAHSIDGPVITRFRQLAKNLDIWLSLGGFHEKSSNMEDQRMNNAHLIIDNTGQITGEYRKLHLFDVDIKGGVTLKESEIFQAGQTIPPVVKTPVGNIGLSICYDLRFPELSLILAKNGAEILTYPSAFTFTTGSAHWEVLLKARAIETQCYVIAAAQTGQHNPKRKSYGHAMVVDPWGAVIAQCSEGEDVCFATIDVDYLKKVRTQLPVWNHRRYDVYEVKQK